MTDVLKEALALKEYCTGCRQTVHQNPELSFQEFQTTAFIRRQLEEMGVLSPKRAVPPIPPKILAQPTPADMMVMWPSCWA